MGKISRHKRSRSPSTERSRSKRKNKESRKPRDPPPDPQALYAAAAAGDRHRCRSLLRAGADPAWTDSSMATALHAAARNGNTSVVRLLLRAGASAAAADLRGDTPAHLAARQGHLDCLTDILRSPTAPDPRERNDKGESIEALAAAAMASHDRRAQLAAERARAFEEEEEYDEAAWRERLRREMSPGQGDEDGAFWGKGWHPDDFETPEEYAQRIWAEMEDTRRRREAAELAAAGRRVRERAAAAEEAQRARDQESERKRRRKEEEAAWRAAVAREDPAVKLASYEARWEFFCSKNGEKGGETVHFGDIPWILPSTASEPAPAELCAVLLADAGDAEAQRRVLRRELVRWHPDKFIARFGAALAAKDKERVLAAVTATGAALTALLQSVQADR